ncbi:GNAT family N-acetyltransferase [Photobacterium satsumensis]|uniref:GNAT family N-acetyltransferase n=1 Tax=Photobacterium satsumensis TaxID=2910239 RepID=UPI003D152CB8
MLTVKIKAVNLNEAALVQNCAFDAFQEDFNKYGSYPPNIESMDWICAQIAKGNFYKVLYGGVFAGGFCVELDADKILDIKYVFLGQQFQDKKIGSQVMGLIEKQFGEAVAFKLLTPSESLRNHHFYEKQGYIKTRVFNPIPDDGFSVFEYFKRVGAK